MAHVLLMLALAVGLVVNWSVVAPGSRQDAIESSGIGLTRESWEELHGTGEPGQTVVSYDNDGASADEAQDAAEALLPDDAELEETFYALGTPAGPSGILAVRYESDDLEELLDDSEGSILVLYQETPSPDSIEPNVARVSITVGQER
jgi:hypothetical protein